MESFGIDFFDKPHQLSEHQRALRKRYDTIKSTLFLQNADDIFGSLVHAVNVAPEFAERALVVKESSEITLTDPGLEGWLEAHLQVRLRRVFNTVKTSFHEVEIDSIVEALHEISELASQDQRVLVISMQAQHFQLLLLFCRGIHFHSS